MILIVFIIFRNRMWLSKEQEKQIKIRYKTNNRLKSLFFQIARISLKPDIFEALIKKWYDWFWIDYSVKKIVYTKTWEDWSPIYTNMYIWFFDMTCIWDQTYEQKQRELQDFYYQIIYWILEKKCIEKSLNVKWVLYEEFMWYTFNEWILNFSKRITWMIFQKMFQYYSKIAQIFDDSFEVKWSKYVLKEWSDFFQNDKKLKMFQEIKYSQAEKEYISWINKSIKEEFKEKMILEYKEYFDKVQEKLQNLILET